MKATKARLQSEDKPASYIDHFETGAKAFAQKIVANFKDYEFFTGRSMDTLGMSVPASSINNSPPKSLIYKPLYVGLPFLTIVRMGSHPILFFGSMGSQR